MQPVPEGYKPLGFVGFTDKGTYTASEVYAKNDIVHNNNTTWRCLVNGTMGIIPAEGANWTVFIASESDSSGITTTDTVGIVGLAGEKVSNQALIDAIAEKVAKQLVTNTSLANALAGYITKEMMSNDQTDDPDKVPTSALAYAMQRSINKLNENMSKCVLLFDQNITNTSTEYAINDDVSHFRIIIALGSRNADKVIRGYATIPTAALSFFNAIYVQESMPGNITDLISLSFFGNKINTYYRGEMSHLRIYGMF